MANGRRGRPRKTDQPVEKVKRPRGRPRKDAVPVEMAGTIAITDSGNGGQEKKTGRPKGSKSGYTVSEKALAQRTKNGREGSSILALDDETKEYNTRVITHALEISSFAPVRGRVIQEGDIPLLQEAFVKYLEACERNCVRAGTIGACSAMGVNPRTFLKWGNNERGKAFFDFASTIQQILGVIREEMISAGKLHPVIGIFWQRNFDGLRNDTETYQQQHVETDDDYASAAAIRKKYGELLKE